MVQVIIQGNGIAGFNMDVLDIGQLLGAEIDQATDTTLRLSYLGPGGQLWGASFTGSGFTYDAQEQINGGTIHGITLQGPESDMFVTGLALDPLTATGWILRDDTASALNTIFGGGDLITGSSAADLIRGFGGNDTILGNGGNDSIFGGDGDDLISGSVMPPLPLSAIGLPVSRETYLRGELGNDSIVGTNGFDDINGNQGNDTIDGGLGGADWLVGGQGNDLIIAHQSHSIAYTILYGNLGDDTCQGGSNDDLIRGGQGNDSITGGDGRDWISGDRGDDTMSGGPGADTFHTFSGCGLDVVTDFKAAEGDRVQVDVGTAYQLLQVGADVVIDMGNGDEMILKNVQLASLPAGWIFTL